VVPTAPDDLLRAGALIVRRYHAADAPALHEAILASVEHLRPWMPWAAEEPHTLQDRIALIERWSEGWVTQTDFSYGVFLDDAVIGGCGLHPRIGPGGLEIGYWVHVDHTGRGVATAAAGALVSAAFRLADIDRLEIHHDRANLASGRVPAKLGFTLVREVPDEILAPGETGVSREWRLGRDERPAP
jgi:RimJ/RimL family protein N-acetyltransferase